MLDPVTTEATGDRVVRIHATNVTGLGAAQLAQSLLPEMERTGGYEVREIFLPARGPLSRYRALRPSTKLLGITRRLPNALSRILECTVFARRFDGVGDLLVLGDIPLRCQGRQTVFIQTPLLTGTGNSARRWGAVKYWVARLLFRANARFAASFIVQSEAMKTALAETYPKIASRIHVIGQPAPEWLLKEKLRRSGVVDAQSGTSRARGLRLFYPAAHYPHKNHALLNRIAKRDGGAWPVQSLIMTIDAESNPNPGLGWLDCCGRLEPSRVLECYGSIDALLFLSLSESFGFPLVEAMWIGLPIVCPDLPYSRSLCGDTAIYFDPASIASLQSAVMNLQFRLKSGWWPDWRARVDKLPKDWADVAAAMLQTASGDAATT